MLNAIVQGWINYYGRYYPSELYPLLRRINYLPGAVGATEIQAVAGPSSAGMAVTDGVARREPRLFAHWRLGCGRMAG